MNKFSKTIIYFFVFSTVTLFWIAQTPSVYAQSNDSDTSRYCPEGIFENKLYFDTNDKPWYDFDIEKNFKQNILGNNRHISGNITPTVLYNLSLRIKPMFNYYCIPGWAESGGSAPAIVNFPETIPVKARLLVGNKREEILKNDKFKVTDMFDSDGNYLFEWKINGYPSGIASEEKMERIIEATKNNEPIFFEITLLGETQRSYDLPVNFSNCVRVWGSGSNKISFSRYGSPDLSISDLYSLSQYFRLNGLDKVDPYKYYNNPSKTVRFDIAIDLVPHKRDKFIERLLNVVELANVESNTCPGIQVLLAQNDIFNGAGGAAAVEVETNISPVIIMYLNKVNNEQNFEPLFNLAAALMHELGHAIGKLDDEYVYDETASKATSVQNPIFKHNCSSDPKKDYQYNNTMYGSSNIIGCTSDRFYRPSENSIMRSSTLTKFNVISCAYLSKYITGWNTNNEIPYGNFLTDCSTKMDVVKSGLEKVLTNYFLNSISNMPALVSKSSNLNTGSGIIEYFSENGTISGTILQGAIIKESDRGKILADLIKHSSATPSPTPVIVNVNNVSSSTSFLGFLLNISKSAITTTAKNIINVSDRFVTYISKPAIDSSSNKIVDQFDNVATSTKFTPTSKSNSKTDSASTSITSPKPSISPKPSAINTPKILIQPSPSSSSYPKASTSATPLPSISNVPSPSATISISPSPTLSISPRPSASISPSPNPSLSSTPSPNPTIATTPIPSTSPNPNLSTTPSPTATPTQSPLPNPSPSNSSIPVSSATPTPTPIFSPNPSPSQSVSPTASPTQSARPSPSSSPVSYLNKGLSKNYNFASIFDIGEMVLNIFYSLYPQI